MPAYIVLMKATQKGLANPKDFLNDVQAAREAIENFGGKMLDWNLAMGPYDAVAKVEFPDDYTTPSSQSIKSSSVITFAVCFANNIWRLCDGGCISQFILLLLLTSLVI